MADDDGITLLARLTGKLTCGYAGNNGQILKNAVLLNAVCKLRQISKFPARIVGMREKFVYAQLHHLTVRCIFKHIYPPNSFFRILCGSPLSSSRSVPLLSAAHIAGAPALYRHFCVRHTCRICGNYHGRALQQARIFRICLYMRRRICDACQVGLARRFVRKASSILFHSSLLMPTCLRMRPSSPFMRGSALRRSASFSSNPQRRHLGILPLPNPQPFMVQM